MEYIIFALLGALCLALAILTIWVSLPTKILGDIEKGLAALGKEKKPDEESTSDATT